MQLARLAALAAFNITVVKVNKLGKVGDNRMKSHCDMPGRSRLGKIPKHVNSKIQLAMSYAKSQRDEFARSINLYNHQAAQVKWPQIL
jgi:hypothetical protein